MIFEKRLKGAGEMSPSYCGFRSENSIIRFYFDEPNHCIHNRAQTKATMGGAHFSSPL